VYCPDRSGAAAVNIPLLYAVLDDATAIAAAERALQLGITLLDAAPLYGHGLAEHRCGAALRRHGREGVVLSTKVGRWMDTSNRRGHHSINRGSTPHRAVIDYSFDGTLRAVEQSLLRLGTDHIDILLIHDVDVWTHGSDAIDARFREAMDGAYPALDRLRHEGTVKAIGVGVNEAEMCVRFARAGDFDTMLLAGRYTLLEQPALAEFLPLAQDKGIGVMLGGVFNSGILATGAVPGAKYNYQDAPAVVINRARTMEAVCISHGVSLPTAALHFALAHPAVSSVVLGATSPAEVERNIAGFTTSVPQALWAELKAVGLLDEGVPTPS
jgi:D-threo-aldose 1-dehydrogenase